MQAKTTDKKIDWGELRRAYDAARDKGEDMLAWCVAHASIYGMSYGQFVSKLGR